MIKVVNQNIGEIETEIKSLVQSNPTVAKNVDLLDSIPGIAPFSAAVIIAEIWDITRFKKAKQLVAYCGLDPSTRHSGSFKRTRNKISKRGCKYLRRILNMATAVSAAKTSAGNYNNPVLTEFYQNKRKSKPHKVALCAVMNKLVHIFFVVLRDRQLFEFHGFDGHMLLA